MPRKDLTGQRFGRLIVIGATDQRGPDGGIVYECLCDCGNTCFVHNRKLTRRDHYRKRSCGCLQAEFWAHKHGESKTPLYNKWIHMRDRCYNPKSKVYEYYGGRGIQVCDEWQHDFAAFRDWALSAGYRDGLSIDRIDVDGNYCPENCKWATQEEQQRNKRNNRIIECNGETHTLAEWAEITGINYNTLFYRVRQGWDIKRALTTPTSQAGRRERY